MKKYLMTLLALVFGIGMVQANPVSLSQAKYVGQQFVQANFEQSRQIEDLTLVYTGTSTRGEACFYVFNVSLCPLMISTVLLSLIPMKEFSMLKTSTRHWVTCSIR